MNNANESIDNAKQNINQLAQDASATAAQVKSTAGTLFDHAKGAANEALAAGSKAAENIVDQKLKEAENVWICHEINVNLKLKILNFVAGI